MAHMLDPEVAAALAPLAALAEGLTPPAVGDVRGRRESAAATFAWIASRWLQEAATMRPLVFELRLMSIAVLNEGRPLEAWYRDFNDRSWRPLTVNHTVYPSRGS